MIFEIKNNTSSLKVDSFGAQMQSFTVSDGKELLWQGIPEFWANRSPVLFPIVGALKDGKTMINGKLYEMPKHGLAKINEFTVSRHEAELIELEFVANEETKKAYPFEFSFKVKFELGENSYKTTYSIENKNSIDMPFCVGAHPGFNVPFEDGYNFNDYVLEFAGEENISSPAIITETSTYDYSGKKLDLGNVKTIPLDKEMFSNDVIVFENLNKNQISIKNPQTGKAIEVNFEELPMLGIWKPYDDAPFVCIEPWVGCSTTNLEEDYDFTKKKHCQILKPLEKTQFSFTVEYK